jgi:AcrR family transcriptional regulator
MNVKVEDAPVKPNKRGVQSREVVLDAAERLMAEQGYETASLNQVCEASGIPISSVYHYFGSKDGLLLAVMERGATRFFNQLPDINELIGTPEEHMALVTQTATDALGSHPDFLRLVVVMAAQPPVGSIREAAEVVSRVREEALSRLRKHSGIVFGIDPEGELADKLSRFCLATFDGAFIAQQSNEGMTLKDLPAILPSALIGLHAALTS